MNTETENGLYRTSSTPTTGIIPNKFHESLKLLNLCPTLHILMQSAVIVPAVVSVFGRTVNNKCLVSETVLLRTS